MTKKSEARKTENPAAFAAPYGGRTPHAEQERVDHGSRNMAAYHIGLPGDLHVSTTCLVLDTANLMGQKLFAAQQKYGFTNGWQDSNWANPKEGATFEANDDVACRSHAFSHVLKGDPVDVANYSAFQMYHGWSSAPQSRDEAATWVAMLQEKFDLIDQNVVLRDLIERMEERHGSEFNAFFEAVIALVLESAGLKSVTLRSEKLFTDCLTLVITEAPGTLTYSLPEESPHA